MQDYAARVSHETYNIPNTSVIAEVLRTADLTPRSFAQMKGHWLGAHLPKGWVAETEARSRRGWSQLGAKARMWMPSVRRGVPTTLTSYMHTLGKVLPHAKHGGGGGALPQGESLRTGKALVVRQGEDSVTCASVAVGHDAGATAVNLRAACGTGELRAVIIGGQSFVVGQASGRGLDQFAATLHGEIELYVREGTAESVRALREGDFEEARRIAHVLSGARPPASRDLCRDATNNVVLLYISCVAWAGVALTAIEQAGEVVGMSGGGAEIDRCDVVSYLLDQTIETCSELSRAAREVHPRHFNLNSTPDVPL